MDRSWLCAGLLLACSGAPTIDLQADASTEPDPSADAAFPTQDSGACAPRCSDDLHTIVDCDGHVVQTCAADQGCGKDGCVAACDSAAENRSSVGCDYYAVSPDIIDQGAGACFAAFVTNNWGSAIQLSVERGGKSYDVSAFARIPKGTGTSITYEPLPNGELPPGKVAILFLARFGTKLANCPPGITPAYTDGLASVPGTGRGTAFHIKSSRPVGAYDIFPYGGGTAQVASATLLLPTTLWETNYVAINAYEKSKLVPLGQPSLDIVAQEDGTTVSILPRVDIVGGSGVDPSPKNQVAKVRLNKGEVLQISQNEELTGSAVEADKPIGVWGGASCLNIETDKGACDTAHQQLPPVKSFGHEYVGLKYRDRTLTPETPPYRLVGAVDGTTLTYDPAPPPGAPSTLSMGQYVKFESGSPFVVRSQDADHPFYMSAYMTGGEGYGGIGDPEFVNVVPTEQYLRSYVFFTDPTYSETELLFVRKKNGGDVKLDCAGILQGWQTIGSSDWQYKRVELVTGHWEAQGSCNNGIHSAESTGAFGLVAWGWGAIMDQLNMKANTVYVSYAYPAGAGVHPLSNVTVSVIPPK